MGKGKTFADKIAKQSLDFTVHCPECGESLSPVKMVTSERSEATGAYRFRQKLVKICKCNEKEILE